MKKKHRHTLRKSGKILDTNFSQNSKSKQLFRGKTGLEKIINYKFMNCIIVINNIVRKRKNYIL